MSDKSNPPGDPKVGELKSAPPRVSLFGRRVAPPKPPEAPPPASPAPRPRRSRSSGLSRLSAFLSFVLIGAGIGLAGFGAALVESRKAGPLTADTVVVIAREDDGGPIAEQLERAGVIDSATWFTAMTLMDGTRGALKRGEYAFKAGVSMREIEAQLIAHKVVQHKLSVPEGLTSDQIVGRLRDDDGMFGDIKEPPREGSLLPDTYFFERGDARQSMLTRMSKAQAKLVDEIWKKRATDLPIKSPGELVTLASIVEKETGKADERPRVAGVFINRLNKHMKLQSDPTIVYGLVFGKGTLGHPITKAELDQPTPYNTYNIDGLPPGPICNPGKAALEAVANPARTKELYFVADGTGGHAFAETLEQHLKNVARWRQIEKDAKDHLAPEATPPATHGELAPDDARAFGALGPVTPPPTLVLRAFGALAPVAPPATKGAVAALAAKLTKYAASAHTRDALLGAGGALSADRIGGKSLEDLGVVVTGVNDQPEVAAFAADNDSGPMPAGPIVSVPMSPAALAEQRAREAKYGEAPLTSSIQLARGDDPPPNPAPNSASTRAHAFDASEGTPLDPLLNRTYDLSFGKTIPDFK
jgi:UPF0755 protein